MLRLSASALLVDGGNAHAAADAQRSQTTLDLGTLLHLMQQGDDDTSAGSAHGVAQRDGAAVDVDLAHVEVQLTGHSDGLSGKGLVGLDQVDVVDGQAGLGHSGTGGRHGANAHPRRPGPS